MTTTQPKTTVRTSSAHSGTPARAPDADAARPGGWAEAELAAAERRIASEDAVHHPAHYTRGKFEAIDVIEDWRLGFCLGNAVKYIARAGYKDPAKTVEDLKKSVWYIQREIARLEDAKPIDLSVKNALVGSDDE